MSSIEFIMSSPKSFLSQCTISDKYQESFIVSQDRVMIALLIHCLVRDFPGTKDI